VYPHGIGTQSISEFVIDVKGQATRFLSMIGLDDSVTYEHASVNYKVRAAADAMVATGLAAHGYQYIVIDDGWEGERDAGGILQPNDKFPDMKELADYVHSKGLKFGIYSSPGPTTCQGLPGSYQHEQIDAETWAAWGVDYLKYDYCGYSRIAADRSVAELRKPYDLMRDVLDSIGRDIVYSIGEYGGRLEVWARPLADGTMAVGLFNRGLKPSLGQGEPPTRRCGGWLVGLAFCRRDSQASNRHLFDARYLKAGFINRRFQGLTIWFIGPDQRHLRRPCIGKLVQDSGSSGHVLRVQKAPALIQ
jgi:hypothetical protein